MNTPRFAALLLWGTLAACAPTDGGPEVAADDDDDSTPAEDPNACHGDALVDSVPISDDLDAMAQRFDENEDLLRIMFLGEPF